MTALGGVKAVVRSQDARLTLAWRALRQKVFLLRVRILASWARSRVTINFAADVRIGRGVRVHVWPGTETSLTFGPRSTIGDNVTFQLKGGEMVAGVQTHLRTNVVIQLGGRLLLDGENMISYGCVLHCAEHVHIGYAALMGEYAAIVDSNHFHTTADAPVYENASTAPVEIGRNTFLGPRVSVGRGVTIGPWSVIGASSVVAKDIPAGVFASGIPAVVVRDLEHPWMADIALGDPGAPDPAWPAVLLT